MNKSKTIHSITNISEYRIHLNNLAENIVDQKHGFFGPGSLAWLVNREGVLGLGAMRALLMQIAHPKVAQGVAEHSNFRGAPIHRVIKTLRMQQVIVFGSCDEAIEALLSMYARHSQVSGNSPHGSYQANDANLQLWVHATLVDSISRAYDTYLQPLSAEQAKVFYQDSLIFAYLMGIPKRILPQTLAEFNNYMKAMIASEEISVESPALDITQSLLKLPLPIFQGLNSMLAAGSLPPALRAAYGLKWTPTIKLFYGFGVRAVRLFAKLLPKRLRWMPPYWRAMKRCRSD